MVLVRINYSVNGSPLTKDIEADERCDIDAEVSRLRRNTTEAEQSFTYDGWEVVK